MGRDQKITVCHLISGDLWAGPEVQVHGLLASLSSEKEFDISVIVLNEGKLARLLKESGIQVTVIDESKNRFGDIVKKTVELLAGRRIDIIHSHRYKENFIATLLKKRCNIGHLVQTVHGIQEPFTGFKRLKIALYSFLNDRATRKFDRIITVSDDIKRELSGRFDASKIVTIHNAVNISRIAPTRASGEVRKELGIGDNQPVIGSVGRMVPIKGFDQFLAGAKLIAEKIPDVTFVLAGDGPLQLKLEHLARSLGLEGKVQFLGYRHDIWDILNCLDLFVMTSHHEGIPVVLLEAMALQRPVVAMSVGGIPEVIEDNVSGRLVAAGDTKRFAEVCLELLSKREEAVACGRAARVRTEMEFSMDTNRDRVIKLYRDMMRRP